MQVSRCSVSSHLEHLNLGLSLSLVRLMKMSVPSGPESTSTSNSRPRLMVSSLWALVSLSTSSSMIEGKPRLASALVRFCVPLVGSVVG